MLAATAAGVPLDSLPCVVSRVDLFPHLIFEAHAFRELSTDRPIGFDRSAIPWRSIDAFAARYGLVGDDFDRFAGIVRALDAAYLAHLKDKPADAVA
ncbi:hypothetical protein [Bradyrhizobium sp. 156]|uniref:phage tail assembly chaperone n=1 Tax=Bradyrhizobium sp. 156 TaxID=2782630 RepID=UPI001FF798DF|nr:hypothetical protein [Bradyrhizobium sp. 156]